MTIPRAQPTELSIVNPVGRKTGTLNGSRQVINIYRPVCCWNIVVNVVLSIFSRVPHTMSIKKDHCCRFGKSMRIVVTTKKHFVSIKLPYFFQWKSKSLSPVVSSPFFRLTLYNRKSINRSLHSRMIGLSQYTVWQLT